MIEDFFNRYYTNNVIRGIQIFDKKLIFRSLFIMLSLLLMWVFILFKPELWTFLIFARLFLILRVINEEMDTIAKNHALKSYLRTKKYVLDDLKEKLHFNHSSQFKELAILLQQKGQKNLKSYNVVPYLAMTLTVLLFLLSLIFQTTPNSVEEIIIIAGIISFIILTFNLVLNAVTNLFFNGKPIVMIDLSNIIFELYFEESIKENNLITKKTKTVKKKLLKNFLTSRPTIN